MSGARVVGASAAIGLALAALAVAIGGAAPKEREAAPAAISFLLAGNRDGRLAAYDERGAMRWATRLSDRGVQPRGACVAADGSLYVAAWSPRSGAGGAPNLFRYSREGVELASFSIGGPDRAAKTVAALPGGDLAIALMRESRLVRFRPSTGAVVWDRATGRFPRGVAATRDGSVWVASKGADVRGPGGAETGELVRHRPDGSIATRATTPLGARGVSVDADGESCWVAIFGQQEGVPEDSPASGDDRRVMKVASSGRVLLEREVGRGPFSIACDVAGAVFVVCARDESVCKLSAADGEPVRSFGRDGVVDLRALAPHPLALALDGRGGGGLWVASNYVESAADERPTPIVRLSADTGAVTVGFPVRYPRAARCEALGDLSGYALASVVDPFGDADRDGRENRAELVAGGDPFDPAR